MSAPKGSRWRLALFALLVVVSAAFAISFFSQVPARPRTVSSFDSSRGRGPEADGREPAGARAGDPTSRRTRNVADRLAPDGGIEAALGLVATPYRQGMVEVPVQVRLERARAAVERFAAGVARLDAERDAAERGGADTTALDRTLQVMQRRLEIAQYGQSRIQDEASAAPP